MSFDSADGNYEVRYKCNVLVHSDGNVLWIPPAIYQVSHSLQAENFDEVLKSLLQINPSDPEFHIIMVSGKYFF